MSDSHNSGASRRMRQLLPAGNRHSEGVTNFTVLPTAKAKRDSITAACNACRKRKAKCSGERPACIRCVTQKLECHYTTRAGETQAQARNRDHAHLRDRSTANEEILNLLRDLPEEDAQRVLQRIRAGTDVAAIVSHVQVGDVLVQMAVQPESRFRYGLPYRSEMPKEYIMNNVYLESVVFEVSSLYSASGPDGLTTGTMIGSKKPLGDDEFQSMYLKPFHAAEVHGAALSDVKLSAWTSVCSDDILMRNLMNVWLRCEYQFTAAFQKDLFLEDAAAGRQDFCSSLLVNVVLGYACVCYPGFPNRAQYWNPHTLLYRFIAEAKRLWELEASEPRITTVQAGVLFSVFHNLCGLDQVGQAYRIQAITLAKHMRLFERNYTEKSERLCHGQAYTAWALFNWETLTAFSFMFTPLLTEPPDLALPDPSTAAHWYGEIWLKYPMSGHLQPSYFGQMFHSRSLFRVIMNEACQIAYTEGSAIGATTAASLMSRLQSWYDDLPKSLIARTIVLPAQLQLHMYFYHLILTIFEPLLSTPTGSTEPHIIVADAKKHLFTIVRLYYLRHGYDSMDLFVVIPLMIAATEALDALEGRATAQDPETSRATLILAAKGLHSQRRNHYLAEALYRVIRGRMGQAEIALFKGIINTDEELDERPEMEVAVRSSWPVTVIRNKEEMDQYVLTNLVESYANQSMDDR